MGLLQRAALVLRTNAGLRKRARLASAGGEEVVSGEQLATLQDIAERMSGMAAAIKQLEAKAKSLDEEAEAVARSDTSAQDGDDVAARAHMQVEVIDEMLDGIRALRAAIDQQRTELVEAEQRLNEGGGPSGEG